MVFPPGRFTFPGGAPEAFAVTCAEVVRFILKRAFIWDDMVSMRLLSC